MTLLLILALFVPCDHTSDSWERFENLRIPAPVEFKHFEDNRLEYVHESRYYTKLGSFDINSKTHLPKDFKDNFKKGRYFVAYCVKDQYVYFVQPVNESKKK